MRLQVHPPSSFSASAECFATCVLSVGRNRRNSLPEVSGPIRDVSTWSPLSSGFLKGRLRSALSVFRALDGLLLLVPCGFVSPHYHVRDSLSGCSPDSCPAWLITSPFPHVVRLHSPVSERARLLRFLLPRLQGVTPAAGPWLLASGLDLPATRSPLRFSAPRVLPRHRGDAFAPPALMTFPADSSCDVDSGLQRIGSAWSLQLSPATPPVRFLWPSFVSHRGD